MMIDYNVSDHWSSDDLDWLKSLVSSFDRRHGVSTVLPPTVIVSEIAEWVQLASGVDAWKSGPNRESLRLDVEESIGVIGPSLRTQIAAPLSAFERAFSQLISGPRATLEQPPGTRTDTVWTAVSSSATDLLAALRTDSAVRASWDDLVATAQDRTLAGRQYRPTVELLFEQLQGRGHQADEVFRDLVSIVAFGRDPDDLPLGEKDIPLDERLTNARTFVGAPAEVKPTVVWLGYKGRIHEGLQAGRVSFYDALWAVPNAEPGRFEFAHKAELLELVQYGHTFRVAERVDEESDVDTIVRVDLGTTTAAGAVERAIAIVDVILSVAIHREGGIRPQLAEHEVLRSGQHIGGGHRAVWKETGFPMTPTARASPPKRSGGMARASQRRWPLRNSPGFLPPLSESRRLLTTRSVATWRCASRQKQTSAASSRFRTASCNTWPPTPPWTRTISSRSSANAGRTLVGWPISSVRPACACLAAPSTATCSPN